MKPQTAVSMVLGLALIAAGCATGTRLEPAPSAETVDTDRVVGLVQGVQVTADADAWHGISEVTEQVTPVKITIENGYDEAIRFRYSDVSMVGSSGAHYAALPPYKIEGEVTAPAILERYDPVPAPAFSYRRFRMAPHYGAVYPGIPPIRGSFYYDPFYYDRYYRYWEEVPLPTDLMLKAALIEGDIDPGGRVSGFVYFERVGDEKGVSLRMDLVAAEDGDIVGTVTIPFVVR